MLCLPSHVYDRKTLASYTTTPKFFIFPLFRAKLHMPPIVSNG